MDTHETHTRIPQVYARLRTKRYDTHSRGTRAQTQVAVAGRSHAASTRTRIARTQTRIVRDGITNRTHADTNRTDTSTGTGTRHADTHTNRTGTGTRTQAQPTAAATGRGKVITICDKLGSTQSQVTAAGRRAQAQPTVAREQGQEQEQGSAHVPARSTQPRAGAGQGHDTTRHVHEARSRTIHARRTRQAAGHAYDTHAHALRITYGTYDTHGTAQRHGTARRPTRSTRLHAYAQQIARPVRDPTGKGKPFRVHVKKDRGVG
jgi:hypothetical protein